MPSDLKISILNVYSTLIIKVKGQSILFDPVEIDPRKFKKLEAIVVTHEHLDHFDKKLVVDLQEYTGAKVLTTAFVAEQLGGLGHRVRAMKAGDFCEIGEEVKICAAESKHNANQGLTFFILSDLGNIFHPNDSEYYPELAELGAQYKPSIMTFVGTSVENMLTIGKVMRPKWIVTHEYPGIPVLDVRDAKVVSLKKNEWFVYPDGTIIP